MLGAFADPHDISSPPDRPTVFATARDVRTIPHLAPAQTIDKRTNGHVRLRFTCVNLTPVVSWVLEWGPHARAMSPPVLVNMNVAEMDAARALYPPST